MSEMARTVSFGPITPDSCPQGQRSHSVVSIALLNENGENDMIEIDEADEILKEAKDNRLSKCDCKTLFCYTSHYSFLDLIFFEISCSSQFE